MPAPPLERPERGSVLPPEQALELEQQPVLLPQASSLVRERLEQVVLEQEQPEQPEQLQVLAAPEQQSVPLLGQPFVPEQERLLPPPPERVSPPPVPHRMG